MIYSTKVGTNRTETIQRPYPMFCGHACKKIQVEDCWIKDNKILRSFGT